MKALRAYLIRAFGPVPRTSSLVGTIPFETAVIARDRRAPTRTGLNRLAFKPKSAPQLDVGRPAPPDHSQGAEASSNETPVGSYSANDSTAQFRTRSESRHGTRRRGQLRKLHVDHSYRNRLSLTFVKFMPL